MTDHKDILAQTVRTLHERTAVYGPPRRAFDDAASMASTALKKDLTAYDVAMIMHFVKISRMVTGRGNLDHYEDGINFLAFAAEFATAPKIGDKEKVSVPEFMSRMRNPAARQPEPTSEHISDATNDADRLRYAMSQPGQQAQWEEPRVDMNALRDVLAGG